MGGPGPRSSDRIFLSLPPPRHHFSQIFVTDPKKSFSWPSKRLLHALHSNEARTHGQIPKLEYRSFAYDRGSTCALAVEVPRSLWSQKMSRKLMKSSNYSQVEAARYPFQLCWRPLAAAEVGAAASGAAGMPVRWRRRPAAASAAVAAGADPDFSCAQWWLMAMICGDPETRHVE